MDIQGELKKGLKKKYPKIWFLVGIALVLIALMAKLILIAGLIIIVVVVYTWYKAQKKPEVKIKKK